MLSDHCVFKHVGVIMLLVLKHNTKLSPNDKLYLGRNPWQPKFPGSLIVLNAGPGHFSFSVFLYKALQASIFA